jgi:hypothetical protein
MGISGFAQFIVQGKLVKLITLVMILTVSAASVSATQAKKTKKARVHFLATGTEIRGTWGFNQDTYFAELAFVKDGPLQFVRIVDEYSQLAPPLSRESLTSVSGIPLRLRRDGGCDIRYSDLHLRTAPGDPMAILPVTLHYLPRLAKAPDAGEVLPCYRIVRK